MTLLVAAILATLVIGAAAVRNAALVFVSIAGAAVILAIVAYTTKTDPLLLLVGICLTALAGKLGSLLFPVRRP